MRNCFESFAGLNGAAMKSIQRIKTQKMKKYNLSSAHTNCICRLESAGSEGLTQTELVRQEMMDPSQISRVLRELTAKGYVQPDGEEGRFAAATRSPKRARRLPAKSAASSRKFMASSFATSPRRILKPSIEPSRRFARA